MVQHLQEASGTIEDSTNYGHYGIASGGVTLDVTGKMGGAANFDGFNDVINMSSMSPQMYNDFRMDFTEWMLENPKATFYEYQEKRLELLYGKYTKVTDELLQKRVETALKYDIGDEVTVDGIARIYMGGNRWKLKK